MSFRIIFEQNWNLEREKGGREKKKQKEKERVCVLIPDDNEKDDNFNENLFHLLSNKSYFYHERKIVHMVK